MFSRQNSAGSSPTTVPWICASARGKLGWREISRVASTMLRTLPINTSASAAASIVGRNMSSGNKIPPWLTGAVEVIGSMAKLAGAY